MSNSTKFPQVPRLTSFMRAFQFVQNPIPSLADFQEKYGDTYSMYMGGFVKGLMTIDPAIIQMVLQKEHRNFEKSELQTKKMGYYLGKGLLTNTGKDWLKQRRLIQPGFHRERLENLIELMMEVINDFGAEIGELGENGPFDISKKMMELSFQIIAKTLFSQPVPEAELKVLSENITAVQSFIIKEIRLPFFGPWFYLSGSIKRHKNLVNDMRKQMFKYVVERREGEQQSLDLLDMLLAARYEDNGEPMADEQLIDEILILFAAGHETSANALSWVWYLLSKHPEATARIREEAKSFFENPITLSSLKNLSYTTRVIQETMRMYPPAWVTDRVALNDLEVDGHKIDKDDTLILYIYGAHHNPKYWKDPMIFDPDRFLPEAVKSRPPFSYLPFGGGPRLCIGNSFAMMEMQLSVAYLVHHFDFSLSHPEKEIEMQPMVTLRPRSEILMNWKKRNAKT